MENTYREKPKQVFCKNCKHLEWVFITDSTQVPKNCLIPEKYIDPIYGAQKRYHLAKNKNKNKNCDCKDFKAKPPLTDKEIADSKRAEKVVVFTALGIILSLISLIIIGTIW